MAITVEPLNGNLRSRLRKVLQAVRELVRPGAAQRKDEAGRVARAAVVTAYQRGQARRAARAAAPGEPAETTDGAGLTKLPGPEIYYSKEEQQRLGRRQTRYERYAANAGYGPIGWSTYGELTLDRIAQIHSQVDREGVLLAKDDTDRIVLRKDPHAAGADRQRRSKVYRAPLLFRPYNKTREARIVCNFIRQVFDDFDGMLDGVSDMLFANMGGVSAQEVVWNPPRQVPVVTGKNKSTIIEAETIAGLEPIFNRYLRFDVVKDRPWIDMGGRTVDPYIDPDTGEPTYKVLIHKTFGDGHARQRGYGFALHYLHSFGQTSWEKWLTILETYGVPTPYLLQQGNGFVSDEDREDAYDALENHGKGEPAVIHARWGELKHAPIPAGVDARGMHAAIIGALNQEKSKLIQGETLSMELGDTGSYKAMDGHENQQENVQWIDAKRSAMTLRTLARFVIEVNAEALAAATGLPPEAVKQLVPRLTWWLDRTVDPVARLGMFKTFTVDMGRKVDDDQLYDEFHFVPAEEGDEEGDEDGAKEPAVPTSTAEPAAAPAEPPAQGAAE